MAKSLQEQLLAAGLVDKKKAKKSAKEMKKQEHLQRTGQENQLDVAKQKADASRQQKAERDRELNKQREAEAQKKAIAAQVKQLIQVNQIASKQADVKYQFVGADNKIKSIYVDQAIFDRLSRGQLAIMPLDKSYAVLPIPVTEKIRQRDDSTFLYIADSSSDALDDDDPYAAYQIPDDLMW